MKVRIYLGLPIFLSIVVCAFSQQAVNTSELLKKDDLGKKLVSAAEKGNKDKITELLAKRPTILSRTIALDISANRNFADISKLLLASGIATEHEPNGVTALMYAAAHGLTTANKELVHNGANVDLRMSARTSPRDPDFTQNHGNNALSLAILNNQYESARILCERYVKHRGYSAVGEAGLSGAVGFC